MNSSNPLASGSKSQTSHFNWSLVDNRGGKADMAASEVSTSGGRSPTGGYDAPSSQTSHFNWSLMDNRGGKADMAASEVSTSGGRSPTGGYDAQLSLGQTTTSAFTKDYQTGGLDLRSPGSTPTMSPQMAADINTIPSITATDESESMSDDSDSVGSDRPNFADMDIEEDFMKWDSILWNSMKFDGELFGVEGAQNTASTHASIATKQKASPAVQEINERAPDDLGVIGSTSSPIMPEEHQKAISVLKDQIHNQNQLGAEREIAWKARLDNGQKNFRMILQNLNDFLLNQHKDDEKEEMAATENDNVEQNAECTIGCSNKTSEVDAETMQLHAEVLAALKRELADASKNIGSKLALEGEVNQLKKLSNEYKDALNLLEQSAARHQTALDTRDRDIANLKQLHLQELHNSRKRDSDSIGELQNRIGNVEQSHSKLQTAHDTLLADTAEERRLRDEENKKLLSQVAEAHTATGNQTEALNKLQAENSGLLEKLQTSLNTISSLELQHVEALGKVQHELKQVRPHKRERREQEERIENAARLDSAQKPAKTHDTTDENTLTLAKKDEEISLLYKRIAILEKTVANEPIRLKALESRMKQLARHDVDKSHKLAFQTVLDNYGDMQTAFDAKLKASDSKQVNLKDSVRCLQLQILEIKAEANTKFQKFSNEYFAIQNNLSAMTNKFLESRLQVTEAASTRVRMETELAELRDQTSQLAEQKRMHQKPLQAAARHMDLGGNQSSLVGRNPAQIATPSFTLFRSSPTTASSAHTGSSTQSCSDGPLGQNKPSISAEKPPSHPFAEATGMKTVSSQNEPSVSPQLIGSSNTASSSSTALASSGTILSPPLQVREPSDFNGPAPDSMFDDYPSDDSASLTQLSPPLSKIHDLRLPPLSAMRTYGRGKKTTPTSRVNLLPFTPAEMAATEGTSTPPRHPLRVAITPPTSSPVENVRQSSPFASPHQGHLASKRRRGQEVTEESEDTSIRRSPLVKSQSKHLPTRSDNRLPKRVKTSEYDSTDGEEEHYSYFQKEKWRRENDLSGDDVIGTNDLWKRRPKKVGYRTPTVKRLSQTRRNGNPQKLTDREYIDHDKSDDVLYPRMKKRFSAFLRQECNELLGIADCQEAHQLLAADKSDVDAFEANQEVAGPNIRKLQVDFTSPLSTKWNNAVLDILVNHVHVALSRVNDPDLMRPRSKPYIRNAIHGILTRAKTARAKYIPKIKESGVETPEEVDARVRKEKMELHRHGRVGMRRKNKYIRRCNVAAACLERAKDQADEHSITGWDLLCRILQELGEYGMSSDESDGGKIRVKELTWRRDLSRHMDLIDENRQQSGAYGSQGCSPFQRDREGTVASTREAPIGMPESLYSASWLETLSDSARTRLEICCDNDFVWVDLFGDN